MKMELTLESNRHKKSLDTDFYHKMNFERSSMVIPVSEINETINTYKVFEDEKNSCTKYRLNITLNPIMSNVLNNKTTIIRDNNNNEITGLTRVSKIQTIDNINYVYECGYDIFDNNYFRIPTFKTGSTLTSFESSSALSKLLKIQKSISNNVVEKNGWFGFNNITKLNSNKLFKNKEPMEFIDLFPGRDYFLFKPFHISGETKDNWDYILTYPYENIYNNKLVTNEQNINGIPIVNGSINTYDGKKYMTITTIYKHGLSSGDVIKIKRNDDNTNNTYLVYDVGDFNKSDLEYKLMLDADKYSDLNDIIGMEFNRICKVINKVDSEYYIRLFRKIPNLKNETELITQDNIDGKTITGDTYFDNDSYQPGFSRNIFDDPIYQLQYIDDININLLKDNLGRPLTEIYLTIIKKGITSGNQKPFNVFTKIMSGIDSPSGVSGYTNIRLINGYTNNELPLESQVTITGGTSINSFFGDIVEYNKSTVNETKLDNIYHRFNTVQRETNGLEFKYYDINNDGQFFLTGKTLSPSTEGYFYNPHYEIKLKSYSAIVNEGEIKKLPNCFDFQSGMTFNNEIVMLSGKNDNQIKSLILKLENISGLTNYDIIRITKKDDKKYINVKISTSLNLDNCIIFPYDKNFIPNVSGITINDYYIGKYSSENIPSYAQDQYNGLCLWRDIENLSENDKELIFTNGRFYINKLFNIYLKRQDPFGYYGLRNNSFPSDVFGENTEDIILNNKYNGINTIC